jgi:hypothetical protein
MLHLPVHVQIKHTAATQQLSNNHSQLRKVKGQRLTYRPSTSCALQQEPTPTSQAMRNESILLARTRVTVRIARVKPQRPQEAAPNMASHSNMSPQVSLQTFPFFTCDIFSSYTVNLKNSLKCKMYQNKHRHKKMGKTQRYEIVRHALKTQTKPHTKTKDITMLTLKCYIPPCLQDQDHDMADSSSPNNNKRSQLIIHQHSQPKKTRCDLQADHDKYASQTLWLGFQTLELLAKDIATQPIEINTSIRELICQGFKESEAAELHTSKSSPENT